MAYFFQVVSLLVCCHEKYASFVALHSWNFKIIYWISESLWCVLLLILWALCMSPYKLRLYNLQILCSVYSEELSRRLHEEEQRHAQDLPPVAAMLHGHSRPYAHAQPASGDRNKKGSVSVCLCLCVCVCVCVCVRALFHILYSPVLSHLQFSLQNCWSDSERFNQVWPNWENEYKNILLKFHMFKFVWVLFMSLCYIIWSIHPSNGATDQISPWPPLLRLRNNNVLRCKVVSLTTNPR
jgi:hypothetical protein